MTKQLVAAALTGCIAWAASSTPVKADPIYVEVQTAPAHVETYPQTVYEGRPVYYVDGRWYYQNGPRWAYYREEPRPLIEYRATPAYRTRHHEHIRGHHGEHRHHGRD
jgi:hypothetical protein